MHLFTAVRLPEQIYKNVAKITPDVPGTTFMARVLNAIDKENATSQSDSRKKNVPERNEVLYAMKTENRVSNPTERQCFRCGKSGHFAKNCQVRTARDVCNYCNLSGHSTQECRKRQRDGIPFCRNCTRINHREKDCRANCGRCRRKGHTIQNCRSKPSQQQYEGTQGKQPYNGARPKSYGNGTGGRRREQVNCLDEVTSCTPIYHSSDEDSDETFE